VYDKKLAEISDISVVEAVDVKPTEPEDKVEASILQSIRESENAKEIPVIAETVDATPEPEPVVEQPIEIETASTHETIIGTQVTPIAEVENNTKTQDVLELGKPLAFSADEKHSFAEWLQLSSLKPIDRSEPEPEETATLPELESPEWQKKQALIDKFIETNPKIPAIRQDYTPPAPELPREDSSLMTETLARVYLEQKKYQKAIQAYEILILKYPEKSIFFADRISEIKKLQQNN
jgi:tetratricopeptide (TPR) repeat protein